MGSIKEGEWVYFRGKRGRVLHTEGDLKPCKVILDSGKHVTAQCTELRPELYIRRHDYSTAKDMLRLLWNDGKAVDATMLHFDTHSDLDVPPGFTHHMYMELKEERSRSRVQRALKLNDANESVVCISSFILPLVALRLIKTVIWVRPPWQTDGGSIALDGSSYDMWLGFRSGSDGEDLLVVGSDDKVPARLKWLWSSSDDWSDSRKGVRDIVPWRLVLVNLKGYPPRLSVAQTTLAVRAVRPGKPLVLHIDEDVHYATNPQFSGFAAPSSLGPKLASKVWEVSISKQFKKGTRVLEFMGKYGSVSTARRKHILRELQSLNGVAHTAATMETVRNRCESIDLQRAKSQKQTRKAKRSWSEFVTDIAMMMPQFAPKHDSDDDTIEAVASAIKSLKTQAEQRAKVASHVVMCRSPGFLPPRKRRKVEELLLGGASDIVGGTAKFVFRP